jgi:predicted ATPase
MFTELRAGNFKSWRVLPPTRLGGLTGFFGANSSGKTSLLQLLLLLKQTSASTDRAQALRLGDERTLVELGSFRELIYERTHDHALNVGISWRPPVPLVVVDSQTGGEVLFVANEIKFDSTLSMTLTGSPEVDSFTYMTDSVEVTMSRSSKKHGRKLAEYEVRAAINGNDYLRRVQGRAWPLPSPVKCYGFPDEATGYYQNSGFLRDLELAFDRQFNDRTFYLGPLRSNPKRQYPWKGTHPEDVGITGELAVEALLASRERGRSNTRGFDARGHARKRITVEQHVAEWLKDLGLVSSFEVERLSDDADIYRVLVKKTEKSTPVFLTDVGFGVSQILPVLVLLAYVPEGSTVLLEQPEIHLHPAVQSQLADVLLEAASTRRVQVIVESHSEHLLRRLQRRVAEGKVTTDDLALYFCEFGSGGSSIRPLDLNVLGEISNWPKDFFGDPLGESAAIARAALMRQSMP